MSSIPVFVGLDYHQNSVQVCVMGRDGQTLGNRKVENEAEAIRRVVQRYGTPEGVAIEACCGSANLAEELHTEYGWAVGLAHAGFVARMKQSPDKTDYSDARLLADLLRVGYLPKVWLAPKQLRELRHLVRWRTQQVRQRRNTKLRIRALLRENRLKCPLEANAWTKAWVAWVAETEELGEDDRWIMDKHLEELKRLNKAVDDIAKRLAERTQDDAVVTKLRGFRGIGLITAVMLRAEIGRFDRFHSGKQLARYCGLSPKNASSGERQADAGLIRAGNRQLRATLIELGQRVANQADGDFSELVARLLKKGKPRNVVVAAVANRYIRRLFHQMQPERLAV